MFTTRSQAIFILTIVALEVSGLQVSLDRKPLHATQTNVCSQLVCEVNGDSLTIDKVTVTSIKVTGQVTELLTLTPNTQALLEIYDGNIRAKGRLQGNSANISIEITDTPSCQSDFIACSVHFTVESGRKGEVSATIGPEKQPKIERETGRETPVIAKEERSTPASSNLYLSELWFLRDRIAKVETKFATLSDRLESRIQNNMDVVQSRAGALENSVLERVSSVETDFSSRVSRLEDRLASILLAESPDTRSEVVQSVTDIERRLEEMAVTLNQMNVSSVPPSSSEHHQLSLSEAEKRLEEVTRKLDELTKSIETSQVQSDDQQKQLVACKRGIGFRVTKIYPPYLITTHEKVNTEILCDTHTDGGGWIIFQRRTVGDVDFYKNWDSYKHGFGSLSGDFWLGNDALHNLTKDDQVKLRVEMRYEGKLWFAEYSDFKIDNETKQYRLHLKGATGPAQDGSHDLSHHHEMYFSTYDRDNDKVDTKHCAISRHGAWWYNKCSPELTSNLNGVWGESSPSGVNWRWGKVYSDIKKVFPYFTEMKLRIQ